MGRSSVGVTDDALIIHGERKYEHEDRKGGVYRSERRYGQFYREIPLPEGAKTEQAKANFKDGVLEVVLSVPEAKSNRRTIPIESGSSAAATSSAQKEAAERTGHGLPVCWPARTSLNHLMRWLERHVRVKFDSNRALIFDRPLNQVPPLEVVP